MAASSTMGYQKDPFEFTATGILGTRRDTMLNNEILLRVRTFEYTYINIHYYMYHYLYIILL